MTELMDTQNCENHLICLERLALTRLGGEKSVRFVFQFRVIKVRIDPAAILTVSV